MDLDNVFVIYYYCQAISLLHEVHIRTYVSRSYVGFEV